MTPARGRFFVAAMALVTAWSLWAVAQPKRHEGQPRAAGAATAAPAPHPPSERAEPAGAKHSPEAESEEPRPINWTEFGGETPPYIAMVVNFGILAAGYYLLGRRPLQAALQARRDSVAKEIEQAAQMKREAEERAKVYQAKLAHLEQEMAVAREGLMRAGEAERERIIAEAEAKAERMRKDAEFLAAQELKQVRQDLLRDTVEAAVQAAAEVLGKRVTASDQERLAEDYLADLAGRKSAPPPPRVARGEAGSS